MNDNDVQAQQDQINKEAEEKKAELAEQIRKEAEDKAAEVENS